MGEEELTQKVTAMEAISLDFTRRRRLNKTYSRVTLDEIVLQRLALVLQRAGVGYGRPIDIAIVSASGDETIQTNSPDFFLNPNMPSRVQSVSMSLSHCAIPVSIRIDPDASRPDSKAMISADGTDVTVVSGTFGELERILEECRQPGGWLSTALGFVAVIVGSGFLLTGPLLLLLQLVRVFQGRPPAPTTLDEFGELLRATMWMGIGVALPVHSQLAKLFPGIEDIGRLADPGTVSRRRLERFLSFGGVVAVDVASWLVTIAISIGWKGTT